jgi:hypothetical protein
MSQLTLMRRSAAGLAVTAVAAATVFGWQPAPEAQSSLRLVNPLMRACHNSIYLHDQ